MQLDTLHDEGENKPFQPLPDIYTWLKENRLETKFKSNFEENDVITEDLLKYDEHTIKLFLI